MSSKIFAKYLMTFTFVIYAAIVSLLSGCSADAPPAAAENPMCRSRPFSLRPRR